MSQLLLFADPRPLVDRLGAAFFQRAPETPGVYLMRDCSETVLYVGKAKNLRKRLASYRVANPDRLPRRHLRLLRAVDHVELRPCANESSALATESALLRTLRPRFNRAGTWPGTPRYVAWRITSKNLELAVTRVAKSDWHHFGPMGGAAFYLRAAFARLIWCAMFPERGAAGLPEGWFAGRHGETCNIPSTAKTANLAEAAECLGNFLAGQPEHFTQWVLSRTCAWTHPFDLAVREADFETVNEPIKVFAER